MTRENMDCLDGAITILINWLDPPEPRRAGKVHLSDYLSVYLKGIMLPPPTATG